MSVWNVIEEGESKGVDVMKAINNPSVYQKLGEKISKAKEILDSFKVKV